MTADEELLSSSLGRLGDGELNDAELDRRVIKFQGALRRLRADPAEAARIDVLVAATEFGEDPRPQAKDVASPDIALMVRRAAEGDQQAWEHPVDHYARLIWAITKDFRLAESDAEDVAQTTWLRLLEHIDRIEYPERVGSWLAATARNECLRVLTARKRVVPDPGEAEFDAATAREHQADVQLLADERTQAVRDALSRLPRRWQRLLERPMADPPASYAKISVELELPPPASVPLAEYAGQATRATAGHRSRCRQPYGSPHARRQRVSPGLGSRW